MSLIDNLIESVRTGSTGRKAYVCRTLRQRKRISVAKGSSEKMYKAGIKAAVSARVGERELLTNVHEYIDRI